MEIPLQISFRNMETSPAVEDRIREEVEKLSEFYRSIIGCRVMVEIPHRHRAEGKRFHVRIYLTVPGGEIVAEREPSLHAGIQDFDVEKRQKDQETAAPHKDVYVAIRDAFKSARRQLEDFAREQRGDVKRHPVRSEGVISRLFPDEGYGFIKTTGGEEIYFDRTSLPENAFDKLTVGTQIDFVEETAGKGTQAAVVRIAG